MCMYMYASMCVLSCVHVSVCSFMCAPKLYISMQGNISMPMYVFISILLMFVCVCVYVHICE